MAIRDPGLCAADARRLLRWGGRDPPVVALERAEHRGILASRPCAGGAALAGSLNDGRRHYRHCVVHAPQAATRPAYQCSARQRPRQQSRRRPGCVGAARPEHGKSMSADLLGVSMASADQWRQSVDSGGKPPTQAMGDRLVRFIRDLDRDDAEREAVAAQATGTATFKIDGVAQSGGAAKARPSPASSRRDQPRIIAAIHHRDGCRHWPTRPRSMAVAEAPRPPCPSVRPSGWPAYAR